MQLELVEGCAPAQMRTFGRYTGFPNEDALKLETLHLPNGAVACYAFSPDGTRAAVSFRRPWPAGVLIYNVETRLCVEQIQRKVNCLRYFGNTLIGATTTSEDRAGVDTYVLRVFEVHTNRCVRKMILQTFAAHPGLSGDMSTIFLKMEDHWVRIVDLRTGNVLYHGNLRPVRGIVTTIVNSPGNVDGVLWFRDGFVCRMVRTGRFAVLALLSAPYGSALRSFLLDHSGDNAIARRLLEMIL